MGSGAERLVLAGGWQAGHRDLLVKLRRMVLTRIPVLLPFARSNGFFDV